MTIFQKINLSSQFAPPQVAEAQNKDMPGSKTTRANGSPLR